MVAVCGVWELGVGAGWGRDGMVGSVRWGARGPAASTTAPVPTSPRPGPAGELAGVVQPLRLLVHLPLLLTADRGGRRPVVVMPGRSTGDATTLPLRAYLRTLGHRPHGWGLGTNDGDVDRLLPLAVDAVAARAEAGGPIALVGQSLGGFVAREVARSRPDLVDRVVTLGTPIFARRSPGEITCPVTAIWSPADRIVGPSRSVDRRPGTDNVEVGSTHFAMGLDPDVWRIVARALAAEVPAP